MFKLNHFHFSAIIFIVCIASSSLAQIFTLGKCSKKIVDGNINLTEFSGKWYLANDKCITTISRETNSVFNEAIIIGNKFTSEFTTAQMDNTGVLTVSLHQEKLKAGNKFTIIGTDYQSYAVIYSCDDNFIYNTEIIWVLSRTKDLDPEAYKKALTDLKRHKLSKLYLSLTTYDCKKFARQLQNPLGDSKKDVTTFFKYFLKIYKLVMKVFK